MLKFDNKGFKERTISNLKHIAKMNEKIKASGGLFCQYRPCRKDENTIYDIENILHGVVYARSPLYMNDPFDSEIGFSTEKVIDDIIEMYTADANCGDAVKNLLRFIIKNKLLGSFTDLVKGLNDLKKELNILLPNDMSQQQKNNARRHLEAAIKKLPKNIQKIFNKKNTANILLILLTINELEITEQNVCDMVLAQKTFDDSVAEIERIKQTVYERAYKKFLSTVNISCFTASGWKNPLMWAHYANSYEGICIEYDFNKLTEFVGFIYQVEYSRSRPLISIQDLGTVKDGKFQTAEVSDETTFKLLNYLLVKDKVWEYEKEWRILDVQDTPNTPSFIPMPHIKSITLGTKIDPLIKNWIIYICADKNIECYELKLSYESFEIDRTPIDVNNYKYDGKEEEELLNHLSDKITVQSEKLDGLNAELDKNNEEKKFDYKLVIKSLSAYEDILISSYFLKIVLNRAISNNKEEALVLETDLKETVKKFDALVQQQTAAKTMKEKTFLFALSGVITFKQKKELDKKLNAVINVTDYYLERKWAIADLD